MVRFLVWYGMVWYEYVSVMCKRNSVVNRAKKKKVALQRVGSERTSWREGHVYCLV